MTSRDPQTRFLRYLLEEKMRMDTIRRAGLNMVKGIRSEQKDKMDEQVYKTMEACFKGECRLSMSYWFLVGFIGCMSFHKYVMEHSHPQNIKKFYGILRTEFFKLAMGRPECIELKPKEFKPTHGTVHQFALEMSIVYTNMGP